MNFLYSFGILFTLFVIIKILFSNLKSKFYQKHQILTGKETIPLIGGVILFCFLIFNFKFFSIEFFLGCFFILVLGIFSDMNILRSPKTRLIIQVFIIFLTVYALDLRIVDLRNDFFNQILENKIFNSFFTIFCLIVLVNGSNFIDGLDGLNLGYYFIVIISIFNLVLNSNLTIDLNQILIIIYVVSFLLILNILNLVYLGDSGSYLIGFIFGYLMINIYSFNYLVSPYFIALVLWYPAFENLFSIIRKKIMKKNPFSADNLHLHQKIFNFFSNQNNKFIKKFANLISSLLINSYNFFIIFIATNYYNSTVLMVAFILLNISLYLMTYVFLKKY